MNLIMPTHYPKIITSKYCLNYLKNCNLNVQIARDKTLSNLKTFLIINILFKIIRK